MGEWKEYRLSNICDISAGGDAPNNVVKYPSKGMTVPVFSNGEKDNGLYGYTNLYKIEAPAVTISARGNVGFVCFRKENFVPIVRLITAKANEQIVTNEYLYYCLRNTRIWGDGSVQKQLTVPMISEYVICIPRKNTQNKIVSILKSLDDKIEVNRKICENLEQQAQALFKSWFVDFEPFKNGEFVESELGMIPKGWRVGRLGEMPITVTDYVANGSFASLKENVKLYEEVNYAYFIRNTDLKTKKFCVFVDEHSYKFLSKSKLEGGEIIISNVGDVGSVHLCPYLDKPMTLGNNIIMVKSDNEFYRNFLYILFRWNYGQKLIQSIKGGSAQPKFNKTDFKSLKIIVPKESVLKRFDEIVSPMFNCIGKKDKEIQGLASLRDTLLPKLMSGEIKVGE